MSIVCQQSIPTQFVHNTECYIGCKYASKILENSKHEQLTYSFDQFDCVTLVETGLAMTLAETGGTLDKECFEEKLGDIRYRKGGEITYANRHHYFSSWIENLVGEGIGLDITKSLGGKITTKKLNYMTTHSKQYPKLQNKSMYTLVKEEENRISSQKRYVLPLSKVVHIQNFIHHGDIIGFATNQSGLDVSHVGIVYRKNDMAYLLHASQRTKQVEITTLPLEEYIKTLQNVHGLIIVRLTN